MRLNYHNVKRKILFARNKNKNLNESKNRYKNIEQREIARQNDIKRGTWKGCLHPIHLNPLYGEKNGRWKGGISDLSVQLRRGIIEWKNLSANFCDYKCILTGNRFQNIHHVISFDSILHTALTKLGVDKKNKVSEYTSEDYDLLRNEIIRLHSDTLYGACLCKELHELFHKEYTYYNSTINDFIGFIELLTQGDYENYLNQNNLKLNMNKNI